MRKDSVFVIFAIALLLLLLPMFSASNVKAWVYQDDISEDTNFERFGPRADKLVIKLYANETSEWDALAKGEIDITDWPLSRIYYDLFNSDMTNPATGLSYNETINTINYGSEFTFYILDINNNPNEYLGNPPNPAYPNPIYPNPTSIKEMRQAIAHLVDRSQLDAIIGEGFYEPLYTIIPPSQGSYNHPGIRPGGTLENITYPQSRAAAEDLLDAGGFPVNLSTGWRFWDRNNDGIEQADEYLELKFPIRTDDYKRLTFANFLADELNAVKVRVNRMHLKPLYVDHNVMLEKNFHLYTGGWQLGVNPDHLVIWCWDYYWHPGFCHNYAGVNDPEFCEAAYSVVYAKTLEEALENARLAQVIFAENAYGVPLWSSAGSKAVNHYYTGGNTWQSVTPDDGENQYRGQYWEGAVNMPGYGIDNFWNFLNMHPQGYIRGDDENMTIRWGFKVSELKMLNPVSAEWIWDWNVLDLIYEPLIMRNPYNLAEYIPWLAEDFEVGTYYHVYHGRECTKIKLKLRSDIMWHDGTPLTTADVYFTWVELENLLREKGIPPPWWCWCDWEEMVDIKLLDPYNFELLFDQQDIWLWHWVSTQIILPKHIWKPLIETAAGDVMTGFAPDPNLIGSGPWRLKEYVEGSHILLVANSPEGTVQTNLPGSTSITSPKGYHKYHPVRADVKVDGTTRAKIDYYTQPHTINYTLYNLYLGGSITLDISITYPNGTTYNETGIVITAGGNWTHAWAGDLQRVKTTSITATINSPTEFEGIYSWSHVYYGTIESAPWGISPEDIAGSTFYDDIGLPDYPYKWELPTPDIRINIKDIAEAARAFGSYPGHERWRMGIADANCDYKVDIRDIARIAVGFGWTG